MIISSMYQQYCTTPEIQIKMPIVFIENIIIKPLIPICVKCVEFIITFITKSQTKFL